MEGKVIIVGVLVICAAYHVSGQVNCTAAGRFPDPADTTCQNYTLCVLVSTNNSYIGYDYQCPTTSVFNPNTEQCTTNYVCNITTATNNASNTISNVCTADGFVADPTSSNCSSYIQCVNINGSFSQTTLFCPAGTFYDSNTTLCDPNYICPVSFTCDAAGRFADTADTTCQTYFMCIQDNVGAFTQYNYTCPSTSVFNPNSALCTTNYTCTNYFF